MMMATTDSKRLEILRAKLAKTVERDEALSFRIGRLMAQRAENEAAAAHILVEIRQLDERDFERRQSESMSA
jgi:hypothetical protein